MELEPTPTPSRRRIAARAVIALGALALVAGLFALRATADPGVPTATLRPADAPLAVPDAGAPDTTAVTDTTTAAPVDTTAPAADTATTAVPVTTAPVPVTVGDPPPTTAPTTVDTTVTPVAPTTTVPETTTTTEAPLVNPYTVCYPEGMPVPGVQMPGMDNCGSTSPDCHIVGTAPDGTTVAEPCKAPVPATVP